MPAKAPPQPTPPGLQSEGDGSLADDGSSVAKVSRNHSGFSREPSQETPSPTGRVRGLLDPDPGDDLRAEAVALWGKMVNSIGQTRALDIWRSVGKGNPGRIKGKKSKPEKIRILLECFDLISGFAVFKNEKKQTIARFISNEAFHRRPGVYGASEDAVTKSIVKALNEREKHRAEIEEFASRGMFGGAVPKETASSMRLLSPVPKRPRKEAGKAASVRVNRREKKGTGI
jgi:hypothetical protein